MPEINFALSVLDLSPVSTGLTSAQALRNTVDLAQLTDGLGYTRYWLAEHHNTRLIASSVPEVMIGHVANATKRIRVGFGRRDVAESFTASRRRGVSRAGSVASRSH